MRAGPRTLTACLVAVGLLAGSGLAIAGSEPDPNTDDTILGMSNGLRYSADSEAFNLMNSGYASVSAGCGPERFNTVGGGVRLLGPPAADKTIASTGPDDWYDVDDLPEDGWRASGYGQAAGSIRAFAICLSSGVPEYRFLEVPDGDGSVRSAKLRCRAGSGSVLGGGGQISTSESFLSQSHPYDGTDRDKRPDDGWAIRAFDTVNGLGGMYVRAACKRGTVRYATASDVAPAGGRAVATAECPGSARVTGGGAKMMGPGDQVHLAGTYPLDRGDQNSTPDNAWRGEAHNGSAAPRKLTVWAICRP